VKKLLARLRTRTAALVHDLIMVPIAWLGGLWLRFNLEAIPEPFWQRALTLLPLIILVHAAMFFYFGLYRGVWRFASMPDFARIAKAVGAALLLCALLVLGLTGWHSVPRSLFVLHGLLLLLLLCAPRFCYRWLKDHHRYFDTSTRVLIVGAGRAGETLAREFLQDPNSDYRPIVFVDDDSRKWGTEVRGLRVIGGCRRLPKAVAHYNIDLIFIAIPSASAKAMRRLVGYCEASGKPFRTLPRLRDLLTTQGMAQELRAVSIEDLLGREPVAPDWQTIRQSVSGRVVLISGGGGSIGSELCRQAADLQPTALVILERNEFNLYQIERELHERFPRLKLHAHLGDVCDSAACRYLMRAYQPDIVLHAAAYKHVPLLEQQAREALRNNLFGTINLATAADHAGCQTFVLISTDKAVNPSNILGASKQLAEIYCQHCNRRSSIRFVTVRFGNVLDSAGSVIPLFREQIRAGGPVTVTHPQVSRYFMTIAEASQLILQAGAVGADRDIYVLNMGEPINIRYLAEQMILLSGKRPGEDIAIEYTGLRPGEKLSEELVHADEDLLPTPYSKLLLVQHRPVNWRRLADALTDLRAACERYDEVQVRALTQALLADLQTAPRLVPAPVRTAHG